MAAIRPTAARGAFEASARSATGHVGFRVQARRGYDRGYLKSFRPSGSRPEGHFTLRSVVGAKGFEPSTS